MNERNITAEKKAIRRQVQLLKTTQSPDDYMKASSAIAHAVENIPEFISAGTVLAYWSFKGEVHTHELIRKWAGMKRILLPSVDGNDMVIRQYTGDDTLIPGDMFGIPEPDGPIFKAYDEIDFILVPGVAFDRNNNRMGRGKAYYDRFLRELAAFKAGVCFDFQLFGKIPADEHDVRMDIVITESFQKDSSAFRRI